jgi:hypothetical protein
MNTIAMKNTEDNVARIPKTEVRDACEFNFIQRSIFQSTAHEPIAAFSGQ